MAIELVQEASAELEQAFVTLIPQLSSSAQPFKLEELEEFLSQDNIYLLVYRADTPDANGNYPILGMLTLVTFQIPTGWRAWIEDVVVDSQARGQGAGQQLVEAALDLAKHKGVKSIDLTSRPSRAAANRLYQRCGFQLRETNVYRFQDA